MPLSCRWAALLLSLANCGGQVTDGTSSVTPPNPTSGIPSCRLQSEGANQRCGAAQKDDCCAADALPGGTFLRENRAELPATVSPFRLDRFETTVGRFRAFVEAYPGSRPKPGDGSHPKIAGSGWRAEWDASLPADAGELRRRLLFQDVDPTSPDIAWTEQPSTHEQAPINALSWELGFAFCAWDGGRLPTEAEWLFAAVGGDEQRPWPWGDAPIDETRAVNLTTPHGALRPVGSVPAGAARWGQMDFNGSRWEFVYDALNYSTNYILPCQDCAQLENSPGVIGRRARDLSYAQNPFSYLKERQGALPGSTNLIFGVRCARDL